MASARWLLFVPPAAFGLLAGLFLAGMFRDDPDGLPSTLIGRPAPPVALVALGTDPPFTDADLRAGEGPRLVNFWASWCPPCRKEHPILTALAAEGIPVFGVNYKDTPERALGFLDELGDPFVAHGADPQGRTGLAWGLYGVPETFVLDAEGRVVLRFAGEITPAALEAQIRPALERAAR